MSASLPSTAPASAGAGERDAAARETRSAHGCAKSARSDRRSEYGGIAATAGQAAIEFEPSRQAVRRRGKGFGGAILFDLFAGYYVHRLAIAEAAHVLAPTSSNQPADIHEL